MTVDSSYHVPLKRRKLTNCFDPMEAEEAKVDFQILPCFTAISTCDVSYFDLNFIFSCLFFLWRSICAFNIWLRIYLLVGVLPLFNLCGGGKFWGRVKRIYEVVGSRIACLQLLWPKASAFSIENPQVFVMGV